MHIIEAGPEIRSGLFHYTGTIRGETVRVKRTFLHPGHPAFVVIGKAGLGSSD